MKYFFPNVLPNIKLIYYPISMNFTITPAAIAGAKLHTFSILQTTF